MRLFQRLALDKNQLAIKYASATVRSIGSECPQPVPWLYYLHGLNGSEKYTRQQVMLLQESKGIA